MEAKKTGSIFSMSDDQFKRFVAVSIALISVLVALITYLQSDAAARDDQANRDSKRYSVEAFGRQVSGQTRVNFDDSAAYQSKYELDMQAAAAEQKDDAAAARRYQTLSEKVRGFAPLLNPPYMDAAPGAVPDVPRYEGDVYLREITILAEQFTAAWDVKGAWDYKANTYIFYLMLLAVALFLFGLSVTVSNARTRWLFAGAGIVVSVIAVVASVVLWMKPVFDLREQGNAIPDYAEGVVLAHQEKYSEAVQAFDRAVVAYPAYTNALAERGAAHMELNEYEKAVADYTAAQASGDRRAYVAGDLAWAYYLLGQFPQSIDMNLKGLQISPDELWIQFDLGLSHLAAGHAEEARAAYEKGMEMASRWVADAAAAKKEPPSFLWWSLGDASESLDGLFEVLDSGQGNPPAGSVADAALVESLGGEMLTRLKSLEASLEYTNLQPSGQVSAQISPLQFVQAAYNDQGEVTGYSEPSDTFESGIKEVYARFDYSGMKDGQNYLFKVYVNGVEDPSWRIHAPWDLGPDGTADVRINYAYNDAFSFAPGVYTVELYIDYNLVQRADFTVSE